MPILNGLSVLSLSDTRQDLLNENHLVLRLDPLEPTDEVLITLPWPDLPQTIKVEEPLVIVSENVRDELSKVRVGALDPLSWVDTLWNVLELLGQKIIQLPVNHGLS